MSEHKCNHEKCFEFCKNKFMDETDLKFVTIDKISKQTDDEYLFKFNTSINHDPGQFMQLNLFGIGESAISFCSYNKEYFEMSIRNVGNVTAHLCKLKKGDKIAMRGPYGTGYHMQNFHSNNVVVVAGGSGVAPVRGIMQYIQQHRDLFGTVDLFFGFRTMHHMLFEQDYKDWEKSKMNLNIILGEKGSSKYKEGRVTDYFDCNATNNNENKIVFVCGPPPMIDAVCKDLINRGFNKDQIYISEERQMKCAVGRCGHCMIEDKYCCTDGPVFRYDELEGYQG